MKHAPKLPLPTTEILWDDDTRFTKALDVFFEDSVGETWMCSFPHTKFVSKPGKFKSIFVYLPEDGVLVNPFPEKNEMYVVPTTMSFDELVLIMKKNSYSIK